MTIERLQRIRDRIANGIPPEEPIEDVRFLLRLVNVLCAESGNPCNQPYMEASRLPPRRKRCEKCNATGKVEYEIFTGDVPVQSSYIGNTLMACDACHGTGYQEASE